MTKQAFDLIRLNICGNSFIVPRDAGMAVFNLFANHDVYRQQYEWASGGDGYQYAALVEEGAVKLESIGPVEFVKLRAEAERKVKEAAEKRAKEKA